MALVYDDGRDRTQAGTHVFIVGVDDYPWIHDLNVGLAPLSSSCRSAEMFHQWVRKSFQNHGAPLSSVRLLLSPTSASNLPDSHLEPKGNATRESFFEDAIGWAEDLSGNRDSIGMFLFSGHGFGLGFDRRVLALSDVGKSSFAPFQGCVSFDNFYAGLAPSARFPEMARQQYFFLDSCADSLPVADFLERNASHIFAISMATLLADDRVAPIFSAAVPGGRAFARVDGTTFFVEALLNCLSGAGAEQARKPTSAAHNEWVVTAQSLSGGLNAEANRIRAEHAVIHFSTSGRIGHSILHELSAPPMVPVRLDFSQSPTIELHVRLKSLPDDVTIDHLVRMDNGQAEISVPAGVYEVELQAGGAKLNVGRRIVLAYPPEASLAL